MQQKILLNKGRGLYGKFFERLKELEKEVRGLPYDGFIPYSYVYEKLCRNYSIKKQELKEVLLFLRDMGIVEISQVGIKLNFRTKKER
jgi:hypothetical protein